MSINKSVFECKTCNKNYKSYNSLGNHNRKFHQSIKKIKSKGLVKDKGLVKEIIFVTFVIKSFHVNNQNMNILKIKYVIIIII